MSCEGCQQRQAQLLDWARANVLVLAGVLVLAVGLLWGPTVLTRLQEA